MTKLEELENAIKEIQSRNEKVELDKKWETSFTRRFLLMLFTYITIGLYLQTILIPDPWLNAIVPTIGFFLSTLTLPFFKELWEKWK